MYTLTFKNQAVDAVGKSPINVPVGAVDSSSTSLVLTGKGAANFGKFQQENLIRLLETFADSTAPNNPTVGQLWYDSATFTLKVLVDANPQTWKSLAGIQVTDIGDPPPSNAALGDVWFSRTGPSTGVMYVYTGIGRYPTTATTIGGWEQTYPDVETYGGREEYDLIRELVERMIGSPVGSYGSGALGRATAALTDFGALDLDLRAKYKALGDDSNNLVSATSGTSVNREITRQAPNSTMWYHLDGVDSSDGVISGFTADLVNAPTNGTIYIDGVSTVFTAQTVFHGVQAYSDAYLVWDTTGTLVSTITNPVSHVFIAIQADDGSWRYDNNSVLTTFTPIAGMYAIGTISVNSSDNNAVSPIDVYSTIWEHAVPLIGAKYEHLKVEPNSQDWDLLLAAAKYALNRIEVPTSFVYAVSSMPFVYDGRQAATALLALDSTDVRFPSANRRSNRKGSMIRMVQSFSETVNALNLGIANKFSLQGINGFTGTFPYFKANTVTEVYAAPPSPGLSGILSSGSGGMRIQFRFASAFDLQQFLASGGAIQIDMAHSSSSGAGNSAMSNLISQAGVWRVTGDKVRIFGSSLPLTVTQPTGSMGIYNGAVGYASGNAIQNFTLNNVNIVLTVFRPTPEQFDLAIGITNNAGGMSGTSSLTFTVIRDAETYLPGPNPVYAKPLTFQVSDIVDAL